MIRFRKYLNIFYGKNIIKIYFDFFTAQNGKIWCVVRKMLKKESYVSQEQSSEYCDFNIL
jgi:hypothetical protein